MMKVKNLKANNKNPRKMSDAKKKALQKSLIKFGDISCIVFNRKTDRLLGGHQRSEVLPRDSKIIIDIEYPVPTKAFTVAIGYIQVGDERFKYREVDAPESWENEALIAANKHSGEWDNKMLGYLLKKTPTMDFEVAGFDHSELQGLGVEAPYFGDISTDFNLVAIEDPNETDEQYLKKNKGPESFQDKERLPNTMLNSLTNKDETPSPIKDVDPSNPFDEEEPEKRHVLIIDCTDDKIKRSIKKAIKKIVTDLNGEFV